MSLPFRSRCRALAALAGGLVGCGLGASVQADSRLTAQYIISMTRVPIGRIIWIVDIGERFYAASANGKASGVLSVFMNGQGSIAAQGLVTPQRLAPTTYISNITDEDGTAQLRMTYDDFGVKDLATTARAAKSGRSPVTEAARRDTSDPLSAVLIPAATPEEALLPASCGRVLPIFDGEVRYDLTLSYKRYDRMQTEGGYSGPVLVCGIRLRPIAGYRTSSPVIKYIAGREDMELWFAPIAGTPVIAPIRVVIPTLIGTFEIKADRFETSAAAPPEIPVVPNGTSR